jgi:hypothetical protein
MEASIGYRKLFLKRIEERKSRCSLQRLACIRVESEFDPPLSDLFGGRFGKRDEWFFFRSDPR